MLASRLSASQAHDTLVPLAFDEATEEDIAGKILRPAHPPLRPQLPRQNPIRRPNPLAQNRPRIPRIDDLFDPERLRRPQRRTKLVQRPFDLPPPRVRIR